jgi:hypothetical protein
MNGVADRNPLCVQNVFFWLPALLVAYSKTSLYNCTLVGVSYVYKTSLTNYENLEQTEGKIQRREDTKKGRYKEGKIQRRKETKEDEARY